MIIERFYQVCNAEMSLEGESFLTVLSLLDCAFLCMDSKNCSSFLYSHDMRSCLLISERDQHSADLNFQAGINYYSMVTKELLIPKQCEKEPTYVNQGAVRLRQFSRPGYPVVIQYDCDQTAEEKYKYFSGSGEALCDDQGNWTLPAMFCIPTSCYTKAADSSGAKSALYGGDTHQDQEGRECQAWSENKPHKPNNKYRAHGSCSGCGSENETGNKCRDGDDASRPWCYTMDPKVRWAYCDIPKCKPEIKCARPPILRGAIAVRTELIGQKVHVTYRCHKDLKYMGGKNVSICDMKTGVWEWPYLLCASEECFYYDRYQWQGAVYLGNVSTEVDGTSCQRWDSQAPHRHKTNTSRIAGVRTLSELGNKCRDPSDDRIPWCYTTDPKKRWEWCPVSECCLQP